MDFVNNRLNVVVLVVIATLTLGLSVAFLSSTSRSSSPTIIGTITDITSITNNTNNPFFAVTVTDVNGVDHRVNASGYINQINSRFPDDQQCYAVPPDISLGQAVEFNLPATINPDHYEACSDTKVDGHFFNLRS